MKSASNDKDFSIAIVGGGMCGLACAVGLIREGVNVSVFESAAKFGEIGAGVGIGPNAVRALRKLGIFDVVLAHAKESQPKMRLFSFVSGAGNHEPVFDYSESAGNEPGLQGLGIYRPAFLDALIPMLPPHTTHFNMRCTSVETAPSGRQLLRFANGKTFEADLVIGTDGIRSTVRKSVVDDDTGIMGFSNTYAYRGLVPVSVLKAEGVKTEIETRPFCWVGLDKHIITFPIKDDTVLNVVAFVRTNDDGNLSSERPQPWVEQVPQQELVDAFSSWGSEVKTILHHLKEPSRWSIHTVYPPLKSYVKGAIVLVGDAAHAMLPHLGAGVGQGLEDVYTLCRLLTRPDTRKSNLTNVLSVYDKLRPPRAGMVLERSIHMGKIYDNFGAGRYDVDDMRRHLTGMWEPVWHHDLDEALHRAIEDMETTS